MKWVELLKESSSILSMIDYFQDIYIIKSVYALQPSQTTYTTS